MMFLKEGRLFGHKANSFPFSLRYATKVTTGRKLWEIGENSPGRRERRWYDDGGG